MYHTCMYIYSTVWFKVSRLGFGGEETGQGLHSGFVDLIKLLLARCQLTGLQKKVTHCGTNQKKIR